jgi:hypothetical protein
MLLFSSGSWPIRPRLETISLVILGIRGLGISPSIPDDPRVFRSAHSQILCPVYLRKQSSISTLFTHLFTIRITPFKLLQCDPPNQISSINPTISMLFEHTSPPMQVVLRQILFWGSPYSSDLLQIWLALVVSARIRSFCWDEEEGSARAGCLYRIGWLGVNWIARIASSPRSSFFLYPSKVRQTTYRLLIPGPVTRSQIRLQILWGMLLLDCAWYWCDEKSIPFMATALNLCQ